jgi:3alpha(or 20beta)-hydroxysteroid dehydrogenase
VTDELDVQQRLAAKIAIVSGGARGIGEATVRRLVAEGARVVIGDILVDQASELAKELGDAVVATELDVTDPAAWDRVVARCTEVFGPPNILVSNAGVMCVKPFEQTTTEDFDLTYRVNALGAFYGIRAVVPAMRKLGGGSIVTVSSTAGTVGVEYLTAYCASKAANATIARCAALEFSDDNIRVNSVHPGGVLTAMSQSEAISEIDPDELYQALPLRRIGRVEEVAALIAYLASDDASYTTGGQHIVDGGLLAGTKLH